MEFSDRLKTLRLESGYTQQELAQKIGLSSQGAYRKYETGEGKPRAAKLEKLASIFGVSVSYLLGETDIRSSSDFIERMANLSEAQQEDVIKFLQKQEDTTSAHQEENSSNSPQKKR
ncbi:helix-turn-helix transcriptional regulator [Lactococcus muris]|uniref:Helix-turn-helix transcriptional regulator n=1 Tax=Lactococcus muris TaxID=2941330 RepID=A0ABV4D8U9_9LACT|nr:MULTISPECIES: helix-turn-helix transcriptional regulator [unclassified Lactococcus]